MGVVQREEFQYFRVSKGKLKYKENGKEMTASRYSGIMVGIREKHGEYEGKPTVQIEVKMKDPETGAFAIIQMTKEAWFSLGFFARIQKVDITKPFTIGVLASKENEKMSFCFLRQEGYVNPDPNKKGIIDADKNFPKYTTVKVSGKDVQDWTQPFAKFDEILKELDAKLAKQSPVAQPAAESPALVPTPDDDLPF